MRKMEFKMTVIFNEDENNHGNNIMHSIEHEMFNIDGIREWTSEEISNEEIEYEDYDDDSDWEE